MSNSSYEILPIQELIKIPRNINSDKKIRIDISETKYELIKKVSLDFFNWKHIKDIKSCNWEICWHDLYIPEDFLRKMTPYQKINHFPGSYYLCRKNFLASHLMKLQQKFPEDFDFFPKTWILPSGYKSLLDYATTHKKVFIAKPEGSCQGKGIFLTKKVEKSLDCRENYIVQEYLSKPFLIDGLKFDFRIYVLIKNVENLKIFIYKEGLARFATEKYLKPKRKNLNNFFMHLTNYSLNKKNPKFIFNENLENDDKGHKRSFSSILTNSGHDIKLLIEQIHKLIIKTICCVQPYLSHLYRSGCHKEENQEMCFEILGFDIILDSKLKPWLLEVNHTPSFSADSPLDYAIKSNLILDTLNLINPIKKNEIKKNEEEIIKYENQHLGGYFRIFPINKIDDKLIYEKFMQTAKKIWDDWAGASKKQSIDSIKLIKQPSTPQTSSKRISFNFIRKNPNNNNRNDENLIYNQTKKDYKLCKKRPISSRITRTNLNKFDANTIYLDSPFTYLQSENLIKQNEKKDLQKKNYCDKDSQNDFYRVQAFLKPQNNCIFQNFIDTRYNTPKGTSSSKEIQCYSKSISDIPENKINKLKFEIIPQKIDYKLLIDNSNLKKQIEDRMTLQNNKKNIRNKFIQLTSKKLDNEKPIDSSLKVKKIFNNKFIQDLCVKYKRLGKQISINENQINLNKNEYME